MLDEQIVKDITELHARLLDHKPILQGHINYFVKEFEEKREDREKTRLTGALDSVNKMKDSLIPESLNAMHMFLANVTAKLKVATEVCKKIEEKENNVEMNFLMEQQQERNSDWEVYMKGQNEKCEKIDFDFEEQVRELHKNYDELENKLNQTRNLST